MGTDDPDENQAVFHQGLHCLFRESLNTIFFLEVITCDPSIYTIDRLDFIVGSLCKIAVSGKYKSRLLFSSAEMFKKPLWQTAWTQISLFWVHAVYFYT